MNTKIHQINELAMQISQSGTGQYSRLNRTKLPQAALARQLHCRFGCISPKPGRQPEPQRLLQGCIKCIGGVRYRWLVWITRCQKTHPRQSDINRLRGLQKRKCISKLGL